MPKTQVAGVTDACVYHDWQPEDLKPYLGRAWRELIYNVGPRERPSRIRSASWFQDPTGAKLPEAYPLSGPPGSDFSLFRSQILESGTRARVVLGYDDALLTTAFTNHRASSEVVRAANDWTSQEWLSRDERVFGLIMIVSQLPQDAAAEIRRVGQNPRMVGIALGTNALGQPFGHPAYEPIYEAADEMSLPLVLQVGSDSSPNTTAPPVAGGLPATFAEYKAFAFHPIMSHVANLIMQGVFVRHPTLKVLLSGCGAGWIPAYLWRLNYFYKMGAKEVPWITRYPSDYFREHVLIATEGLEHWEGGRLIAALETVPWMTAALVYGSGYPNKTFEQPHQLAERLPPSWFEPVFNANAESLFRWPAPDSDGHAQETNTAKRTTT